MIAHQMQELLRHRLNGLRSWDWPLEFHCQLGSIVNGPAEALLEYLTCKNFSEQGWDGVTKLFIAPPAIRVKSLGRTPIPVASGSLLG